MRALTKWLLLLGVLVGGSYAAYAPIRWYLAERSFPKFRVSPVTVGALETFVSATGEIKPVLEVSVGAFVSGPIIELNADFNDRVSKGDVLAVIDPRLFQAALESDEANLANRLAEVERIRVLLEQATRQVDRSQKLQSQGDGFISEAELDTAIYSRMSLAAELKIAEAAVKQSQAALQNSRANLEYTKIVAPVDGIVIDRKIDLGQTLAAQFQTPELFVIAPEMDEKMHVYASIDEADIGLVRVSKETGRKVSFVVDAYPDEIFTGEIAQIRFQSSVVQNVVTYPVIVATENRDVKLMPGMTASLVIQGEKIDKAKLVTNAALRFFPEKQWVRPADQGLLGGTDRTQSDKAQSASNTEQVLGINPDRKDRHVWIVEGFQLRAIPVTTGLSDYRVTQVESDQLTEGMNLVVGIETK